MSLKTVIPKISYASSAFAGWLMMLIAAVMGYDVFLQLILKHGTIWVYEITSYGLVWFSFLAAGFVLAKKRHIHVEILISRFNEKTQLILRAVSTLLIILFVFFMLYYMSNLFIDALLINERTSSLVRTPMSIVYFGAALGLLVLLLQSFQNFVIEVRDAWNFTEKVQYIPLILLSVFLVLSLVLWQVNEELGLLSILVLLLVAGVPIFATLGIAGTIGFLILVGPETGLPQIAQIAYKALDSNSLLAIPLYVLSGIILMKGKIGPELYQAATAWLGHIKGGYAIATVLACGIFASISGSSVATAATIGIIAIPEMLKRNYKDWKVYGLLAGGGTLGILIPPSTPMILYSGMTDESTGQLFMGGVIPGLILMILFSVYNYITTEKTTVTNVVSWSERWAATKNAIWGGLLPVIIIGGIYTGLFTPTQAAAVAVIYATVISLLRRKIGWKDFPGILAEGSISSGMILMIIVGALILGQIVTLLKIPNNLLVFITESNIQPWLVLTFITILYLILGMFMEVVSILLITLPVVYPLVTSLGFNGIWFGIFLTILMELALITPPVGLNLFVIKDISKSNISRIVYGVWAYIILMAILLILIILFPQIVLWLPGKLIGNA